MAPEPMSGAEGARNDPDGFAIGSSGPAPISPPPTAKGEEEEAHQTQAVGVHIGRSDHQSECARGWLGLGRPVALRSHSVHNAIVSGLLRFALSTLSRT